MFDLLESPPVSSLVPLKTAGAPTQLYDMMSFGSSVPLLGGSNEEEKEIRRNGGGKLVMGV